MMRKIDIMNNLIIRTVFALLLCFSTQATYSQGTWDRMKRKAKEAWNSDTRKNLWEKTKEKAHAVTESEMLKQFEYTVPVTNRSFYNLVPDKYLLPYSNQQYQSYIRGAKAATSSTQTAQVQRVSKRLISATERLLRNNGMSAELRNFDWKINTVQSSDVNAFCMPGGKIVVYTGILPVAKDDASLACVIGHEIAHAIAKHSAEQLTKKVMVTVGAATLYALLTSDDMSRSEKSMAAILAASGVTLASLKFSRLNETEADRLGLIIAAMAGYDPNAAVGFWQRMGEQSSLKTSRDWFSTHPSNSNRISNIKQFLPEAKRYYKK